MSRIPQVVDNGYQPPEMDLSSERVHTYKVGDEILRKKEEIIRQRNEIPTDLRNVFRNEKLEAQIAWLKERGLQQSGNGFKDAFDSTTQIPSVTPSAEVIFKPKKSISLLPIVLGAGIAMALKKNALLGAGVGYVVGDRFLQKSTATPIDPRPLPTR